MIRVHRPTRWQGVVRIADTQEQPLSTLGEFVLIDRNVETSRSRILVKGERADGEITATVGIVRIVAMIPMHFPISYKADVIRRNLQDDILGHCSRKSVRATSAQRTDRYRCSPVLPRVGLVQGSEFARLHNPDFAVGVYNCNGVLDVIAERQTKWQGIRTVALRQR